MIQSNRYARLGTLMMAAAVVIGACSSGASSAPAATSTAASEAPASAPAASSASANMTACYLTPSANSPYSSQENKQIQDDGASKGLTVTVLSAETNPQTQASQMSDCIAKKVGIIMLTAVDAKAICPSLQKAKDAAIPVLSVSASVDDSCKTLVVGTSGPDYCAQATAAGTFVDKLLGKQGNIVIVEGLLGFSATIARTDCFTNQLTAEGSAIKVLAKQPADFDKAKSLAVTRDLLTKYGDSLTLIYAEDDSMAAGSAQAIDQAGLTGKIKLMSCGGGTAEALDLIKNGKLAGTVYQSPITDGTLAVDTALKVLKGESIPEFTGLENPIVDATNVGTYKPAY
jgi:ribose transport system substrate-binding protein